MCLKFVTNNHSFALCLLRVRKGRVVSKYIFYLYDIHDIRRMWIYHLGPNSPYSRKIKDLVGSLNTLISFMDVVKTYEKNEKKKNNQIRNQLYEIVQINQKCKLVQNLYFIFISYFTTASTGLSPLD